MRKGIVAVIAVLAIVIGGAFLAARNLEGYLNRNREWLAQRAEQSLGRPVAFDRIGVSLARGLAVRVEGVRIADDPKFSDGEIVTAGSAYVRVRLLPALFGRYEIAAVALEGPTLNLVKTHDGLNVAALAQPSEPGDQTGEKSVITIDRFDLEGGQVHYLDRTAQPPVQVEAAQVDLSASDLGLTSPVEFELAAALLGAAKQNLHAEGKVGPLGVEDANAIAVDFNVRVAQLSVDALSRIEEIAALLPEGLTTEGPLSLTADAEGTLGTVHVVGTLEAEDARVRYGEVLDKPRGVALAAEIDARSGKEGIDLARAKLSLGEAELDAAGKITTGEAAKYDLQVKSNRIALDEVSKLVPAAAGMDIGGAMEIRKLDVVGAGEKPLLRGVVALDQVSVRGEDVPPIEGLSTTATLDGNAVAFAPASFRIAGSPATLDARVPSLEPLRATFSLKAEEMPLAALGLTDDASQRMRDVRIDGNYADSRLVLEQIAGAAFGGTLNGKASYEAASARPAFSMNSKLQGVRTNELLAALATPSARVLNGTLTGDLAVSGAGAEWAAVAPTLRGGGGLVVNQGTIGGINLVDDVLEGLTGVPGLSMLVSPEIRQKYPHLFASEDTPFDALQATLRIAGEKLIAEKISLRASEFAVDATGEVRFDQTVDMRAVLELGPALSQDIAGRVKLASALADQSGRMRVPFKLAGTLPSVKPRPDLDVVAAAVRGGATRKLVDALVDDGRKPDAQQDGEARAKERGLAGELQRGLEGLFGR